MTTDHAVPDVERIRRLCQQVSEQERAHGRRQRAMLVGFALLATLSILSMVNIARLTDAMDAEALARIGRVQVQGRLPEGRAAIAGMLAAQAPQLVGNAMESMLAALPGLRESVVSEFDGKLDAMHARFERDASRAISHAVAESVREVERRGLDGDDRLERVAELAAEDFTAGINDALDRLYPHYAAEMNRITGRFEHLMTSDPDTLSPDELRRRELFETLLQLIARQDAEWI